MKTIKFSLAIQIPEKAEKFLPTINKVIWAQTPPQTDEELLEDYRKTLEATRKALNLPEKNRMNWLEIEDGSKIAEIGHTPNSGIRAGLLTVLWNAFVDAVKQDQKISAVLPDFIKVHFSGGVCPFQAIGEICGHPFYFRARHGEWTLDFAKPGKDPIDDSFHGYSGDDPSEGYMTEGDFLKILIELGTEFKKVFSTNMIDFIQVFEGDGRDHRLDYFKFGNGIGGGYVNGNGDGDGDGSGSHFGHGNGNGSGTGNHFGSGFGDGDNLGNGFCRASVDGIGDGDVNGFGNLYPGLQG